MVRVISMNDHIRGLVSLVLIAVMVVSASGCVGTGHSGSSVSPTSPYSHTSTVTSESSTGTATHSSPITSSTSTSSTSSQSGFGNVSFEAVLEVFHSNTIVANYSYSGFIDYRSERAVVSLSVKYRPENKMLTGNWHYEKIKIENGTVKVFNVPPASWTTLSGKARNNTINNVLYRNPYYILANILNLTSSSNGNLSIELDPREVAELLTPMMWGRLPADVSLKGWAVLKNGQIQSVLLKGSNGDTEYVFRMEVFE